MKKNWNILAMAILVVALSVSCGKAPQAEIDAAKAAVDSLKAHGADKIMAEEFTPIQTSLDEAMKSVDEQNSKTFKSYGDAKTKLTEVTTNAAALEPKVAEKKAELMKQVDGLSTEITELNNKTKNMIPSSNLNAKWLGLQNDATAVDASMTEIKAMVEENDLIAAITKLEETKKEAEEVNDEVKDASKTSKPAPAVKKPTGKTTSGGSFSAKKKTK